MVWLQDPHKPSYHNLAGIRHYERSEWRTRTVTDPCSLLGPDCPLQPLDRCFHVDIVLLPLDARMSMMKQKKKGKN